MRIVLLLLAFVVGGCEGVIVIEDDRPLGAGCVRFTRNNYAPSGQNLWFRVNCEEETHVYVVSNPPARDACGCCLERVDARTAWSFSPGVYEEHVHILLDDLGGRGFRYCAAWWDDPHPCPQYFTWLENTCHEPCYC